MTIKIVFAAAMALTAGLTPVRAQDLQLDFDRGQGSRSLAGMVREAAPQAAVPAVPEPKQEDQQKGYFDKPKQCTTYIFKSGEAYRQYVRFQTSFTEQVCRDTYIHDSNGNYTTISQCHDENRWYTAGVELYIGARELRAGETEEIKFCYDFPNLKGSVKVLKSPIEYSARVNSEDNYFYSETLTPLRRKPVDPDPAIVALRSFAYDEGAREFTLDIAENILGLGSDYFGKTIVIGAELVQDKLFDSSRGVKNFEFPINWLTTGFKVKFKEADFDGDKDAADLRAKDKKFFVKWGFRVRGDSFTDKYAEMGKTETVIVR